jgi:hypothetical protein
MIYRIVIALAALLAVPHAVDAQAGHNHAGHSEHAGKEGREVKALDESAIEDYRAGAGMGLALAAELNAYPGPRHVLDLEAELALTEMQRTETQRIFERMQQDAIALGEQIIELEKQLDQRFAHRHIDEAVLADLTGRIGVLNGRLRAVHLLAHLQVTALLSDEQIESYDRLRGYRD